MIATQVESPEARSQWFLRGAFEREYVEENECPKCDSALSLREYRTARTYEAWAVCPACGWRCEL